MRRAVRLAALTAALGISSSLATAGTRTLPLSAIAQAASQDETNFSLVTPDDPVFTDYDASGSPYLERRAVLEFDLSSLPHGVAIQTADLHFTVSEVHPRLVQFELQYPSVNFYGYPGNNLAEAADATRINTSIGGETLNDTGPWTLPLDVPSIQSYADAHAPAVGITTYANSTDESVAFWATGSDRPSIELTYNLYGDANLDDRITGDDFTLIDKGFAAHLTGWSNGDFNGDGVIDQDDYFLIDTAFAAQGNSFSPDLLAARTRDFGPDYVPALLASVPEPSSLAACGLASLALARRRRNPR